MILALIPVHSGSKSIMNKNIKDYKGKPLIGWTIEQAKESKYITDIIVSTDSVEYKKIAEEYGAEVPYLRPMEISGDESTDFEFMKHTIDWLKKNNRKPTMIVYLRPIYPTRKVEDIDTSIKLFFNNILYNQNPYTSLRSVIEAEYSAYKMYFIEGKQELIPLFHRVNGISEPYNNAQQLLPKSYWHNGCIDITTPTCIEEHGSVSGNKILAYIMDKTEIDIIE